MSRFALTSIVALALLIDARVALAQHSHLGEFMRAEGVLEDPSRSPPPITDPRFFGTYCLAQAKTFCKSIPFFPDPCVTLSAARLHVDHVVMHGGAALTGSGQITLDGNHGEVAMSAAVRAVGRADAAVIVPGIGKQRGEITLSADGLELRTSVQNRALALRKDACGNHAPAVTLSAVGGPTFALGQSVMLGATITDAEDTDFPASRIVFSSNLQGVLPGWRPVPRTLVTTVLVPGTHAITVTVTDSGGLTASAQLSITVTNRAPQPPLIYLPAEGAQLVAGGETLLKGAALDPDSGVLPDGALSWSAQLTPGGPFTPLGTGHELPAVFSAENDALRIRLTARDSGGSETSTERVVHVAPNRGNTPPVVVIRNPDRNELSGPVASGAFAGTLTTFTASVWDAQTAPTEMQLRWTFTLLNASGQPDPSPPQPNPAPVTGTVAATIAFPAVGARIYRVTLTATDAGGLASSDSVDVLVTSSIIL